MSRTAIVRGGRVVTADMDAVADVWIEDGRVRAVGSGLAEAMGPADLEIDATGRLVVPGGVDVHVHLDMPAGGLATADDFRTGTLAAAFGGTTTVVDFANPVPGQDPRAALDDWMRRADGRAVVDYAFHVTLVEVPEAAALDELFARGVTSFKMFMAYPGRLYADDATHYRVYRMVAERGGRVLLHAENGIVIDEIVADAARAGHRSMGWHARTRPARLAAEAVHRAAAIAEQAGAALHVVHLDCAEALDEVRAARARGLEVTAETCPQYLLLDAALLDAPGGEGAKYVMSPPLRGARDREALWAALREGTVCCVATDHAPFHLADKLRLGAADFRCVPNGAPGIEERVPLLHHHGVVEGRLGRGAEALRRWVDVCAAAPARLAGLWPRKGTIAPGSDADIVVFDPDREAVISAADPATHHSACDYTAYEGHHVRGWPDTVLVRGVPVVAGGRLVAPEGHGRYLPRAALGAAPDGAAPGGAAPDGAAPDGAAPDGAAPA